MVPSEFKANWQGVRCGSCLGLEHIEARESSKRGKLATLARLERIEDPLGDEETRLDTRLRKSHKVIAERPGEWLPLRCSAAQVHAQFRPC